jgi:DNA invertase Pin-like site-specific DNA recombinase
MTRRIAYLATGQNQPTEVEQHQAIKKWRIDSYVVEGPTSPGQPPNEWNRLVNPQEPDSLKTGDMLVIYSLSALPFKTSTINTALWRLSRRGVTVVIAEQDLVVKNKPSNDLFRLIDGYEQQRRCAIGATTSRKLEVAIRIGRPRRLAAEQYGYVKSLLDDVNLTRSEVAEKLGVTKSTLYKYIAKYKPTD